MNRSSLFADAAPRSVVAVTRSDPLHFGAERFFGALLDGVQKLRALVADIYVFCYQHATIEDVSRIESQLSAKLNY